MVIVDRFTKFAIMKPITKTINARQTAQIIIQEVIANFGTPKKLMTDRGPQFISKTMKCICESLGIHQAMSTPYHPQTDGQTEWVNQEMEQMLCIYAERNPKEWTIWLPIVQMAYNTRLHTSIGHGPYKALFGYELQWNSKMKPEDQIIDIQELHKQICKNLNRAQQKMKHFANRR